MTARPFARTLLPLLLLLLATACGGDDGTPPQTGGEFRAVLESPAGPEGAAVIELRGAGVQLVTADGGALFQETAAGVVRLVAVRDTPSEIAFRVAVAADAAPPTATVVEVSDGSDQLRASLDGYHVRFSR